MVLYAAQTFQIAVEVVFIQVVMQENGPRTLYRRFFSILNPMEGGGLVWVGFVWVGSSVGWIRVGWIFYPTLVPEGTDGI